MNNPNVDLIQQLTVANIQAFTKDDVLFNLGAAQALTPEQRQQCKWQLALLKARRDFLTEKTTITNQADTITNRADTIANYNAQKDCWKCYLLENSRLDILITSLYYTVIAGFVISYLGANKTQEQIATKKNSMLILWSIGIVVVVLFIGWIIGRHKYLPHQKHSKKLKNE